MFHSTLGKKYLCYWEVFEISYLKVDQFEPFFIALHYDCVTGILGRVMEKKIFLCPKKSTSYSMRIEDKGRSCLCSFTIFCNDYKQGTVSQYCSCSWKIIEVTYSRRSGHGRGSDVIIILLKLFTSKFLILSIGVPRRRSPPKIVARWR